MKTNIFLLLCLMLVNVNILGQSRYVFVGTYTAKGSEGVYVYRFDAKTGALSPVSIAKDLKNPAFLTISPNGKFVYVVEEVSAGKVSAFSFDEKTGKLLLLNTQSVNGDSPCHIDIDQTGKWVLVGNYGSGNLTILPVQADGSLGQATQTIQHEGQSINPQRQEKPHVHSVNIAKNNRDVFVPDLGIDQIKTYQLNAQTGKLTPGNPPFVAVEPGAGPRHFAFHPNQKFAYAILELSASVVAYRYEQGKLTPIQTIGTLPSDYQGPKSCADIHVSSDGKFLYGSNRGHNSIVVYQINPQTGMLTLVQHQSTLGKTPRNFAIDPSGQFLLVGNQDSDNIQVFKRNKKTGQLTPTKQEAKVSMPICIKFR